MQNWPLSCGKELQRCFAALSMTAKKPFRMEPESGATRKATLALKPRIWQGSVFHIVNVPDILSYVWVACQSVALMRYPFFSTRIARECFRDYQSGGPFHRARGRISA